MTTINLHEALAVFRRADHKNVDEHAGKLSRFVIELVGEELHATLFARYLTERTGTEHRVSHEEPKSDDKSHQKRLDCYVGPTSVPDGGDPRLHRIFVCEVKSWNDNGLHGWRPNRREVERTAFYSSWLHKELPKNERLAKLGRTYRRPKDNAYPSELEIQNALLIYHPQAVEVHGRSVPNGDDTGSAFWTDLAERPLLVFSGENHIEHLIRSGNDRLDIDSTALDVKLERVKRLFPEA